MNLAQKTKESSGGTKSVSVLRMNATSIRLLNDSSFLACLFFFLISDLYTFGNTNKKFNFTKYFKYFVKIF